MLSSQWHEDRDFVLSTVRKKITERGADHFTVVTSTFDSVPAGGALDSIVSQPMLDTGLDNSTQKVLRPSLLSSIDLKRVHPEIPSEAASLPADIEAGGGAPS